MKKETKEKAALNPVVGATEEQQIQKEFKESITNEMVVGNTKPPEILGIEEDSRTRLAGLEVMSMTELYDSSFPPRVPIIDGLLNCGTYLFVGAPKVGKSFFMAQLAFHVATGTPLWEYPTRQGSVLYLALEDDYARLQQRLSMMFGDEETDKLFLATRAATIKEGLDNQIEAFVREYPDARLIIVDTLQKVREVGEEKYSYANDYENITKFKEFSDKNGLCILIVHHTRKLESSDSFEMISGTNGLLGAADGAFFLYKKKRTDNEAILDITGRDQQDQQLTLERDLETCIWKLTKAENEIFKPKADPVLEAIAIFLKNEKHWEGIASELMEAVPILGDLIPANVLTRRLNVNRTNLYKEYGVCYEPMQRTSDRKPFSLKLVESE
ncbi:AAA domain-containing protein [Pseudobutyrivibrio sp. UC1225]|uniref:AAA family ATPase n=1 Tax=Pseudobutyrivibrio sp. UC1225 TaxID=1798185 RepID=UPI0008E87231|nr:helicase RepA family protein [Pseudobutyrivibrio sp. UC1225]SFN61565.1 AAA domain-containing protein [Pseudobutyrivibrio sp. UC1225]